MAPYECALGFTIDDRRPFILKSRGFNSKQIKEMKDITPTSMDCGLISKKEIKYE